MSPPEAGTWPERGPSRVRRTPRPGAGLERTRACSACRCQTRTQGHGQNTETSKPVNSSKMLPNNPQVKEEGSAERRKYLEMRKH